MYINVDKMTSRSFAKSSNRKINNSIISNSIQFDKLFRENSNRPSAAKSAGTVKKWGITSFTSIRSTNVNGRCSSETRTGGGHPTKRMKIDHGNQNTKLQNTFTNKKNDDCNKAVADINKPKKFFKSRSIPAKEESKTAAKIKRTVSNSSSEQSRHQEQPINRDEEKPPIVLRICKGTASLVHTKEPDPEPYRSPSPAPLSESDFSIHDEIISFEMETDNQETHDSPYKAPPSVTTTIAQAPNESEMRTTRSRAKSIRHEIVSEPVIPVVKCTIPKLSLSVKKTVSGSDGTSDSRSRSKVTKQEVVAAPVTPEVKSPIPKLSLTMKKTISGSDGTIDYNIVRTEYISSVSCETKEPLVSPKQTLPTTTQELIDILSSEVQPAENETTPEVHQSTGRKASKDKSSSAKKYSAKTRSQVSNTSVVCTKNPEDTKTSTETKNIDEQKSTVKNDTPVFDTKNTEINLKSFDQDWLSSSEDSESASSNLQNELQSESQSLLSVLETSSVPTKTIINKPSIISLKKGSIFKSRSGATDKNKRRGLYKHKWCDSDKESKSKDGKTNVKDAPGTTLTVADKFNLMDFDKELEKSCQSRVTSYLESTDPHIDIENTVTSIHCDRNIKGFYTVVKNVKKAHQIQENGEFQEFNDDVEYILEALRENNPNAMRCLSAMRLASKCMTPAFRMHVRAHGIVAKFFKALNDAPTDQSLALCTATVMFVMSQDRLAMDLDRDCLELMLSLLESDANHKNAFDNCDLSQAELTKNKEKVRQLCAEIKAQGHAKQLNLDNITVGQLAMETLLSLTSNRAGEWFKEELRELGGLEHIIKTIAECHRHIISCNTSCIGWNEPLLDKLRKVDRCLRVLENVSNKNEENQMYLLKYNDGILVATLASLYNLSSQEISKYPALENDDKISTGAVIRECLFANIKVLINLTHRFNRQCIGGKVVGCQDKVVDTSLYFILQAPPYYPENKRFDIMMLALSFLINLIEQCEENKQLLITSNAFYTGHDSGLDALIKLFYEQEELAHTVEQKTDAILDGKKDSDQADTQSKASKSQEEFIEETVAKLVQKAGTHMEHTFIAAYVVLLLGNLIMDNEMYEDLVRSKLPNGEFVKMIAVLQKFFNFMSLTASNEITSCSIAATEKVIKLLKMSDARVAELQTEEQLTENPHQDMQASQL